MNRNRNWTKINTLIAMCFALFMAVTDDTVLNIALPQIQTDLSLDVSGLQWILNAYTLSAASLLLTTGKLGDIYGRKRVFAIGVLIFVFASLICGYADNFGFLIAGRILQGVGAAALVPTSLSIVTITFVDPKEKTQAIAIWSAISGLALIAGPILGGFLVDFYGWQSTFFMNVPLGIVAFIITVYSVKETKLKKKQNIDGVGLLLTIIFLAGLTYTLIEINGKGWYSPTILLLVAVSIISLLAFIAVESRSRHPIIPLTLFKNSTFAVVNLIQMLVVFTFMSLIFIFSLFLQQVQGYSAIAAGLRFLPLNSAFVIALLISGWLATNIGLRFTIAIGLIIAGMTALSFVGINAETEYQAFMWKLVISGFGAGLALAPLSAAAMNSLHSTQAGIASALLNATHRLGGVLGIAIQGTILTQSLTSHLAQSLSTWNLSANLQDQLIAFALQEGSQFPQILPDNISPLAWQQAFSEAFVSGLQITLLIASVTLLTGAFLTLFFMPVAERRMKK